MGVGASTDVPALLVIDVQVAVVEGAFDREGVLDRIDALIQRARHDDVPVIFVQHHDEDDPSMRRGTPGWAIVETLDRREGDPVVAKEHRSSFLGTDLKEILDARGVTRVVVTGAQSDYCVEATATAALFEGFDVTVVADAHTTCSVTLPTGTIEADAIVDYVNWHLTWLTHPDRSIEVVPADAVRFDDEVS